MNGKGPGNVLGQDGQQVLIKHGSYYVRVHPCRIKLVQPELEPSTRSNHSKTNIIEKETEKESLLLSTDEF